MGFSFLLARDCLPRFPELDLHSLLVRCWPGIDCCCGCVFQEGNRDDCISLNPLHRLEQVGGSMRQVKNHREGKRSDIHYAYAPAFVTPLSRSDVYDNEVAGAFTGFVGCVNAFLQKHWRLEKYRLNFSPTIRCRRWWITTSLHCNHGTEHYMHRFWRGFRRRCLYRHKFDVLVATSV